MRDVSIIGIGQTPVEEHWERSLRDLGAEAVLAALQDAHMERPKALYVGNMLAGQLSQQANLGALIADYAGFRGIEAVGIEAACASGAAALRMAYLAVASGIFDVVVACGVEKMTDTLSGETTAALASAADAIYEAEHGLSFVALNALLMQRYMYQYGYQREDFAGFAINAHRNAVNNPYAMFRRPIDVDDYLTAKMISTPVSLLDSSPIADGAAAVVLAPSDLGQNRGRASVRILASAVGTDSVALHDRRDPLFCEAAYISSHLAYAQAGLEPDDMDFFEVHDAFTITAALSLEASGYALRGEGVRLAMEDQIGLQGRIPISTMGGLKARGHPVGATGIYQVVEASQQLRGEAGENQLRNCHVGMTQSIGGSGATAITHILQRIE
ncbi:MAG: acetyl-CoA acetyltransferase [Chloroflexi bacterium RBG_13_56_8]|nr:MAG: acetyl-CoA acetyltransferase [Chloroflexi bacterium RBG_13_56_8]